MKHSIVIAACAVLISLAVAYSGNAPPKTCKVTLRLIDAATGRPVAGMVRITDRNGKAVPIMLPPNSAGDESSVMSRGLGLVDKPEIERWSVVPGPTTVLLPREPLLLEAFSGLETEMAHKTLDLTDHEAAEVGLMLMQFYSSAEHGMRSANTHLHLMKLSREQADQYLIEVPKADGLDAVFVSYLERAEADNDYISNRYSRADLEQLGMISGTVFGHGEEHRHNFDGQGRGYGHVMLLDIPRLIQPVSIGPGITKTGTDGLPLQRGIDEAHREAATVIWCHNTMGIERIANLVSGRLNAINIFDGGTHGSYKDSFYRALNAGLKVPFSTGTDWFMYDFSRTYAKVPGPLTTRDWLQSLSAGHSYITNGPFLEFSVNNLEPGNTVSLDRPGTVSITAQATGRVNFDRIEVIQNGQIIRTQPTRQVVGHHLAEVRFDLPVSQPCWLALRIPPPPVPDDPELQATVPINEYGQPLFAHTSAVDVEVGGKAYFDRKAADELLKEMKEGLKAIDKQGTFADDTEKARVVDVYHDAITAFEKQMSGTRPKR